MNNPDPGLSARTPSPVTKRLSGESDGVPIFTYGETCEECHMVAFGGEKKVRLGHRLICQSCSNKAQEGFDEQSPKRLKSRR